MKLRFFKITKFNIFFEWSTFIMVNFIMKLPQQFRFSLKNTPKNAKNIAFRKNINLFLFARFGHFSVLLWPKMAYYIATWSHTVYTCGFKHFQQTFFSKSLKMANFGLNWKCLVGGFTMFSNLLQVVLQDLSSKIP